MDAVVHTASPVNLTADHPDEQVVPAVKGTLGLLRSAAKEPSIKRVLYLSSCAAILNRKSAVPIVYDESYWNTTDVAAVEQLGRGAEQLAKYCTSKTLAERGAWAFWRKQREKGAVAWDFMTLNPPWVFGPVVHEVKGGPDTLNDSNIFLHAAIIKGEFPPTE